MTSSEPKNRLWIFCPQMTLHDIPKIPQIGVKGHFPFSLPLAVQFELRHSVRLHTQINTQTYQFYSGSQ